MGHHPVLRGVVPRSHSKNLPKTSTVSQPLGFKQNKLMRRSGPSRTNGPVGGRATLVWTDILCMLKLTPTCKEEAGVP